ISDTLVPTTYLVDTTLSNSSDSDQTVQAVRLQIGNPLCQKIIFGDLHGAWGGFVLIGYVWGVDWPPESPDNQYHLNK
ncbi:hypothetical protein, partial [Escherichia coli]|uniref:hypothetical protein n=1 Tax=Escherichia coli TaxID=562 RepID=UPI001BB065FD